MVVEIQTTYEEYKDWTEDGAVADAVQAVYEKAKTKAETLMVFENELVTPFYIIFHYEKFAVMYIYDL